MNWPVLALTLSVSAGGASPSNPPGNSTTDIAPNPDIPSPDLVDDERKVLERLVTSGYWPHQALAAMRLVRYPDDERAIGMLAGLQRAEAWQVRCFAVRAMVNPAAALNARTMHPYVLRCALRRDVTFDRDALEPVVAGLYRRGRAGQLLAAEIAAASGHDALMEDARDHVKRIIHRMDRAEAGAFSPRLNALTGAGNLHTPRRWRDWMLQNSRVFTLRPFPLPPPSTGAESIAGLDAPTFIALADYLSAAADRDVDLALLIDCTSSMFGELGAVQQELDQLVIFLDGLVDSLQVGIIAYRDRRDEFKVRGFQFTSDPAALRTNLWSLTASGGGDTPEAVHDAFELALHKLNWRPDSEKMLVLVGDAPPHVGTGTLCVQLAERGNTEAGLITHTIAAAGKPVKHFEEIATAGGGEHVLLANSADLVMELAALSSGGRFDTQLREFFETYLLLCR